MIRNNFFHGLAVVDVGLVTLGPIHVIGLGVENGGDVRLNGDESLVVAFFQIIDDGGDVSLAIAGEDVFRFYIIIERVATVLDVDVDDVLTHGLVKLPRILPRVGI